MIILVGSYLLLVFVLPVALSALVSYRSLPIGRRCPQCQGDTLNMQARLLQQVSRLHRHAVLQRRWCLDCGWEGAVRLPRRAPPASPTPTVSAAPLAALARGTHTLDVRSVQVDGCAFRVMLQCWSSTGLFYGRLLFVGATGRLWLDSVEAFSGSSQREVLGQAQALPDGLLQNRLRRLVADA